MVLVLPAHHRAYDRIVVAPARTARTWLALHRHRWSIRRQTRARTSHYRTRAARAHSP
ncbi:hypothetical protein ABZT17_38575 [Streptomyces sp. NPDC005648]|uniref:hypothetical protein n=1 Tax=Streptomyces sp. NPDC005648 TaxID=3157044 RepID=UPI0033A1DC8C